MTKTKKGPRPTVTNTEQSKAPAISADIEEAARLRVNECNASINSLLQKFNCRIVPFFEMEQIGQGPLMKAILQTNYGLVPNP